MKVQYKNKRPSTIKFVVLAIVILVTLLGVGVYWYMQTHPSSENMIKKQQEIDTQNKQDLIENTGKDDQPSEEASKPPTDASNITITATQETNGNATIITKLVSYSDGDCVITITNGAKKYTNTAPIIFQPEYSTCAGFSVAKSELGAGTWLIELTVTSKGVTLTKTSSLEVK